MGFVNILQGPPGGFSRGGNGDVGGFVATEYNFDGEASSGAPSFGTYGTNDGPLELSTTLAAQSGSALSGGYDRTAVGTPVPGSAWTNAAPELILSANDEFGEPLPSAGFKMEAYVTAVSSGNQLMFDFVVANGKDFPWYYSGGTVDAVVARWKWNTAGGAWRHPWHLFNSTDCGYAQPAGSPVEKTPFRQNNFWVCLQMTLDTSAKTLTMTELQPTSTTPTTLHSQIFNIDAGYTFPSFDYYGIWTPNHDTYESIRIHSFWVGKLTDSFPTTRMLV